MQNEFEMSLIGQLIFFLGLQIKQVDDLIYIHHLMYVRELLKKFKLNDVKEKSTTMDLTND